MSQGISRSPFHVKLWAGLTASILFVMTTLFICVPKFAFRGSFGCIHQVLPTSRVSGSLHSAGCVSFSSISQGVTFPFRITACHFFAALLSCWPGPSFGYSSCRMSHGFLTGGQGTAPLHSCWSAGGQVTDALVVVSSENPDVLAASHHVCVIYLLIVDWRVSSKVLLLTTPHG